MRVPEIDGFLTPVIKIYSSEDDYPNNPKYIIQILNNYRFLNYVWIETYYPIYYSLSDLKSDLLDEDKDKIDLNKQYRIYLSDFNITRSKDLGITNSIQIEYNDVEMAGCNPDCYWNTVDTTPSRNKARCITINLIDQTKKYLLDRNYIAYADTAQDENNFDGKYGPIPNSDGTVDLSKYAENYIANYSTITEVPQENVEYLNTIFTNSKYKVINMSNMFANCTSLIDFTNLNLGNWDTSNVTSMAGLIDCLSNKTIQRREKG